MRLEMCSLHLQTTSTALGPRDEHSRPRAINTYICMETPFRILEKLLPPVPGPGSGAGRGGGHHGALVFSSQRNFLLWAYITFVIKKLNKNLANKYPADQLPEAHSTHLRTVWATFFFLLSVNLPLISVTSTPVLSFLPGRSGCWYEACLRLRVAERIEQNWEWYQHHVNGNTHYTPKSLLFC